MSNKLYEEERNIYQMANIKGNKNKYGDRNKCEYEELNNDEFREINPIFGCLIPCLKCCIYPCRAFFLTGKCLSKKRRMKKNKKKITSKNKNNNNLTNNCVNYNYPTSSQNQKPPYNQFYSASSNIGNTTQVPQSSGCHADGSTRNNLRHPNITGNCITPICSGSSASFCTIQAEYPNRRSVLPSSSSYGPRRYVEKCVDELQDFNETNKLTYCCLGNIKEETLFKEKFEKGFSIDSMELLEKNPGKDPFYQGNIQNNEYKYFKNEYDERIISSNHFDINEYQKESIYNLNSSYDGDANSSTIFSSCLPCNYSDIVNSKYNQGNCFVDN